MSLIWHGGWKEIVVLSMTTFVGFATTKTTPSKSIDEQLQSPPWRTHSLQRKDAVEYELANVLFVDHAVVRMTVSE